MRRYRAHSQDAGPVQGPVAHNLGVRKRRFPAPAVDIPAGYEGTGSGAAIDP